MSKLTVDISRLKTNARYVVDLCREKERTLIGVVKNTAGFPPVIKALQGCGVEMLGVSRIEDYEASAAVFNSRPVFISVPGNGRLQEIPGIFDMSFQAEIRTIQLLGEILNEKKVEHRVLLMVDMGDLREGFSIEEIPDAVAQVNAMSSPYLKFAGIGVNFGCCCGFLPDRNVFSRLKSLVDEIESFSNCDIDTVSIGGAVVLNWLQSDDIPERLDNIRVGETFFFGNIPILNNPIKGLESCVVEFSAEIVEIKDKWVNEDGKLWVDAFGRPQECMFTGMRKRALMNFGEVDTEVAGLTPRIDGMAMVASNSDYTIFDITECDSKLEVGQEIKFSMDYISMARAFLSPYVEKLAINAY